MTELFVPLFILLAVSAVFIIIIRSFYIEEYYKNVEITIDGNADANELEKLVISTLLVAEKHFPGATVYIEGGDSKTLKMLQDTYGIYIKD